MICAINDFAHDPGRGEVFKQRQRRENVASVRHAPMIHHVKCTRPNQPWRSHLLHWPSPKDEGILCGWQMTLSPRKSVAQIIQAEECREALVGEG